MAADEPRWEKPQAATFACKFDVVLSQPQRDRAPVQDAVQALLVGEAHFVRALVSGSTALSASAGEALDKAIGVADAQRAGGVHRVPLVGGLLGWVVAPLAARLPYASAARRREVDEGTACAALLRLYRGALRCANGALVTGALDLRRSYVLFLGVGKDDGDPEAVAAGLARWGRGAFAAFLEFAPAAARAAFAVATASLAAVTDGDEGLRQLNAVHRSPRSLARRHAALGVALFHVAMSRRHEDAGEDALRDAYLDEGLHVLRDELRRMPDNAAAHWAASHAVRRKGDRASALAHLGAVSRLAAAGVEGDGDGGRRPSLDGGAGRVAYRPRLDHAMLLCGDLRFEEARTALAPLVAAESDYGAKCMALSWIAAVCSCLDDVDGAKDAYAALLKHPDKGRVDAVLARRARVASTRSSAMLAKLALPELLLMMGHLAHYARDDPHLLDLLDLYRPVQHAAEARYEPSKKNDRPREELAAACLCEGALLQCCRVDDARCEDLLARAAELGDARGLEDPFHRPFAHYELGLLYRRTGDEDRAVRHLRKARDAAPGFSFDKALAMRAQFPLEAILKDRELARASPLDAARRPRRASPRRRRTSPRDAPPADGDEKDDDDDGADIDEDDGRAYARRLAGEGGHCTRCVWRRVGHGSPRLGFSSELLTSRRRGMTRLVLLLAVLSTTHAFAPHRRAHASLLRAATADLDALSYRELQAACKAAKLPAKGAAAVLRERLRDAAPEDAAPMAVDVAVAAGAAVDVDAAVAADDDDAVFAALLGDATLARAAAPDDDDDDFFAALLAGGDDEDYVAAALATAADAAVDGVAGRAARARRAARSGSASRIRAAWARFADACDGGNEAPSEGDACLALRPYGASGACDEARTAVLEDAGAWAATARRASGI
ncbi:endonuclease [Aureococcus anophagefferens]|uniref:Endonuclease n=1 Tax=Aureococcus anophagefferens TaxID=44056 RepID=A0ABR1FX74_AURAN